MWIVGADVSSWNVWEDGGYQNGGGESEVVKVRAHVALVKERMTTERACLLEVKEMTKEG